MVSLYVLALSLHWDVKCNMWFSQTIVQPVNLLADRAMEK